MRHMNWVHMKTFCELEELSRRILIWHMRRELPPNKFYKQYNLARSTANYENEFFNIISDPPVSAKSLT